MAQSAKRPATPPGSPETPSFDHTFCMLILKKILQMEREKKLFTDMSDPETMPLSALGAACLNHLMWRIMLMSPGYTESTRISRKEYDVMIKTATKFLTLTTGKK